MLAYAAASTSLGGPVDFRTARMRSGRVTHSMLCILDGHFGQARTSIAKTRARSRDHEYRRARIFGVSGVAWACVQLRSSSAHWGTTARRSLALGANTPKYLVR